MKMPDEFASPDHIVSFTGYRPMKLPNNGSKEVQIELYKLLKKEISEQLLKGHTTYINGCMAGWDILAGEAVINLRDSHPELKCITVAPFRKSFFSGSAWTKEWKGRALEVYRKSNLAFALSEDYRPGIYYARNRFLVDHSHLLICYYDGKSGGTQYTVNYATVQNLQIINLADKLNGGKRI